MTESLAQLDLTMRITSLKQVVCVALIKGKFNARSLPLALQLLRCHNTNYDLMNSSGHLRGDNPVVETGKGQRSSSRKYTTSITKTKAADYDHVKWIEDKIPRSTWSEIMEFFGYKHLEEITVRRQDDVLYKFREGDIKRLRREDIEYMLLLLVQSYHQIQTAERDEEETTFFTRKAVVCYKRMTFGLKNTCSTYQRLIDKVFNNQIVRNLKVHVDDMVIKSDSKEDMLIDIQETFDGLRAINMKINPRKCSFHVEEGPFLGHLITKQGIKANPSKVKAISDLKPPKMVKEMQSLNKKLASLNLFLSKGDTNAYSPNHRQSLGNIYRSLNGKYKSHHASRKRKKASSHLLYKQGVIRGITKLPRARKTHTSPRIRRKKASKMELRAPIGYGAGLMLVYPEGKEYNYALRFEFETTNNEEEYEALLAGQWTLRSKTTSDQAVLGLSKGSSRKLQQLFHGTWSRSVVSMIMKLGYYWPSIHIDAKALIQRREACQIHSSVLRNPKQEMTPITSTWPFSQCGIDIVGPLPVALGGISFGSFFLDVIKSLSLEYEHVAMNLTLLEQGRFIIRTSLTGFPAQSVRSSNADALDSLYLLVSLYRTPQSRLPH
ncbi:reverse transcriptase domain-containing protein [Tanacetum coccineum]